MCFIYITIANYKCKSYYLNENFICMSSSFSLYREQVLKLSKTQAVETKDENHHIFMYMYTSQDSVWLPYALHIFIICCNKLLLTMTNLLCIPWLALLKSLIVSNLQFCTHVYIYYIYSPFSTFSVIVEKYYFVITCFVSKSMDTAKILWI